MTEKDDNEELNEAAETVRDWVLHEPTSKPPYWAIRMLVRAILGDEAFEEEGQ